MDMTFTEAALAVSIVLNIAGALALENIRRALRDSVPAQRDPKTGRFTRSKGK